MGNVVYITVALLTALATSVVSSIRFTDRADRIWCGLLGVLCGVLWPAATIVGGVAIAACVLGYIGSKLGDGVNAAIARLRRT